MPLYRFPEFVDGVGLAEEIVHAGRHTPIPVFREHVRSNGDYRYVSKSSRVFVGTNSECGLVAVHDRHLAVHQHDVEFTRLQDVKRLSPVDRNVHVAPERCEHRPGNVLVDLVVLGQQHAGTLEVWQAVRDFCAV